MPLTPETEEMLRTLERQWEHDSKFVRLLQLTRGVCNEVAELRETVQSLLARMDEQDPPRRG